MALLLFQLAAGVPAAAAAAVGFELYPAASPGPDQAYWNASLNSWGGSVYNDSVSLPNATRGGWAVGGLWPFSIAAAGLCTGYCSHRLFALGPLVAVRP